MKILCVVLLCAAVVAHAEDKATWVVVQCTDTQSQKDNGQAVEKAFNTWASENQDREMVKVEHHIIVAKAAAGSTAFARMMVMGITVYHRARPKVEVAPQVTQSTPSP